MYQVGQNTFVSKQAVLGDCVQIGHNCIVEDNCVIEDNVFIDSNCIVREGTTIKKGSMIGANCIIGEYTNDFFVQKRRSTGSKLVIGKNAVIRSGTIIYTESEIGDYFQTGHNVTIREDNRIGDNVSIGTNTDIQNSCRIGNYVRLHSDIFMGQKTEIGDYAWIFPRVVFTNDPTPPSEEFFGVHVNSFAVVAAGSVLLPGIEIKSDSLVAAGAVVTKTVNEFEVVAGNPAKVIADIRTVKNRVTGESAYPWRYEFSRNMPWEESDYDTWFKGLKIKNDTGDE